MFLLYEWEIIGHPKDIRLRGKVYNNPKFNDAEIIITSQVKQQEGQKITTNSNSVYYLLTPKVI